MDESVPPISRPIPKWNTSNWREICQKIIAICNLSIYMYSNCSNPANFVIHECTKKWLKTLLMSAGQWHIPDRIDILQSITPTPTVWYNDPKLAHIFLPPVQLRVLNHARPFHTMSTDRCVTNLPSSVSTLPSYDFSKHQSWRVENQKIYTWHFNFYSGGINTYLIIQIGNMISSFFMITSKSNALHHK